MSNLINIYARADIIFVSGNGSYLFDNNGKKYLDFCSGISVTSLGHNHPEISNIISTESSTLLHVSNLFLSPSQEELATLIIKNTFQGKLFFCNSGAEANEAAIKLARLYGNKKYGGKRDKILSFTNSFHGRTYATLSATAQDKIQKGFTPIAPYNRFAQFNDLASVKELVKSGDIVAILLELYQGEGGILEIDPDFLTAIYKLSKQEDIILIFDEIQTGLGRTGDLFAYQKFGIEPDIMSMAKAMANGLPIGAIIAKDYLADYFTPGSHGTTFGGGQMITKVAKRVFEIISDKHFLSEVKKKGVLLKSYLLTALGDKIKVRGNGLLIGVETEHDPSTVVSVARSNGLIIIPAGNKTVRLFPPLNISYDDLKTGADIFIKSVKEIK